MSFLKGIYNITYWQLIVLEENFKEQSLEISVY